MVSGGNGYLPKLFRFILKARPTHPEEFQDTFIPEGYLVPIYPSNNSPYPVASAVRVNFPDLTWLYIGHGFFSPESLFDG
jgi:hypothetical protein